MNEMDFLKGINDIDPELLKDEPKAGKSLSRRTVRWIAVAAALLLALGGTTVYAITNNIIISKFSAGYESGFTVEAGLPRVKWSAFKGEIKNVGDIIAKQYETFTPAPVYSSKLVLPGVYNKSFNSIDEAFEYIGLKQLEKPSFPYDDYSCTVTAEGDEEGRVHSVKLYLEHVNGYEIGAQEWVTILTEASIDDKYKMDSAWTQEFPRNAEFSSYETAGGNECQIVLLNPQFDTNYMGMSGYVVKGCAFYELHLGGVKLEDKDVALKMIRDWADGLD